jgi:hypothetical protein
MRLLLCLLLLWSGVVMADSTAASAVAPVAASTGDNFDFFSDQPVQSSQVVQLPPDKPAWQTVGGPIALFLLLFALCYGVYWFIPFEQAKATVSLRVLPVAIRRGIAMASILFGFAFCFGAYTAHYQISLSGSTESYFQNLATSKLIAMTHAHLFGFTTSFFIIGIPFSMQFNHLKVYQWVFPVGLAASAVDVMSWWGIRLISPNFVYITALCGVLFSISYLWMLIGLLRVLLFPQVRWLSDKDQ